MGDRERSKMDETGQRYDGKDRVCQRPARCKDRFWYSGELKQVDRTAQ